MEAPDDWDGDMDTMAMTGDRSGNIRRNATSVLDWLDATAERCGCREAVAGPDGGMSFGMLRRDAMATGTWLMREAGVSARDAVALYLEKSPEALAGMLGVVAAGGFYSVIDPRQTDARTSDICSALSPKVILTDDGCYEEACERLAPLGLRVERLSVAREAEPDDGLLAEARRTHLDTDPLYCNFTSGSTGTPKGVVVSHRSVIDFIPTFVGTFGITDADVIANQAPFDFDVSVKDIYSCLLTGARLQIIPRQYFSEPAKLMDYVADSGATTLIWAVSAMCFVSIMHGLEHRVPTTVDKVMFSGEVMPPRQLGKWRRHLPDATYVNLYGPTEITCNCTYHVIDREYGKDETIPMGRAFANERVFLLGDDGSEVKESGIEGEVCVCGTSLALGYLGDAEATGAVFVQNPLNGRWHERMYRTGDIARYDEAGELVYVGRRDNQIKHLGQRIELGEIEAAAAGADGVEQCCCVYDHKRKRILLFYVGAAEEGDVMGELRDRLPSFMAPGTVMRVEEMPLTKNGKADRRALAEMAAPRRRRRKPEATEAA